MLLRVLIKQKVFESLNWMKYKCQVIEVITKLLLVIEVPITNLLLKT